VVVALDLATHVLALSDLGHEYADEDGANGK
jgi:hypothetical protein